MSRACVFGVRLMRAQFAADLVEAVFAHAHTLRPEQAP